eukprot:SAG11_NODE_10067_length_859_cov_1.118421_2_plen_93_part_01
MRFETAEGKMVESSRNFKLEYKGKDSTKATYSMHNTTLTTLDRQSGDKRAISPGTADKINAKIPELMRISKAILENVIFVHQEDANWPLQPSK